MGHRIVGFLLFAIVALAQERAFEPSMYDPQPISSQTHTAPIVAPSPQGFAKSLFLSHDPLPERVYRNQIFALTVKAIVAREDYKTLETQFDPSDSVVILNPQSPWTKESENVFHNTFYVKATRQNAQLPLLTLALLDGELAVESDTLPFQALNVVALNHNAFFSGVVAESLHVSRFKTSRFDTGSLIMVLEVEGVLANLEDFSLHGTLKGGIDSLLGDFPESKIVYFTIFEDHKERIEFNYFNLQSNRFERLFLPVVVDEGDVSTQIGLNPKESPFQIYKNASTLVVAAFFLLLFAFRKKILYLMIGLLFCGYYAYSQSPFSYITLEADTRIRIIPTEKSTLFFTTTEPMRAEQLGTRDEYIKVLLPTGKIGWVKEEHVRKD
ncbi:MAG: hypothetical protein IBX45_06690 [Campylobacterales bacterium]|nr:hypothetical protein [Campylobacterales bacterium]